MWKPSLSNANWVITENKKVFLKKVTGWHKKDKKIDRNTSFNKKVYPKSL